MKYKLELQVLDSPKEVIGYANDIYEVLALLSAEFGAYKVTRYDEVLVINPAKLSVIPHYITITNQEAE